MTQRVALLLSTALTAFVLAATGILLVSVQGSQPQAASAAADVETAAADQATADPADDPFASREQLYRQRLDDANAQLQDSVDQLAALRAQLDQLNALNATLLDRESTYRQRL